MTENEEKNPAASRRSRRRQTEEGAAGRTLGALLVVFLVAGISVGAFFGVRHIKESQTVEIPLETQREITLETMGEMP